jgi:hypothetical protein
MSKYRMDKSKTTKILSMGLGAALAVITLASFAPLLQKKSMLQLQEEASFVNIDLQQ